MKKLPRWALVLLMLTVLLAAAAIWRLDDLARLAAQRYVHRETGLETHIGRLEFRPRRATLLIEDLTLFNTDSFGGSPFLHILELHAAYERNSDDGLVRLNLLRLHLAEISIVTNRQGRINYLSIPSQSSSANSPSRARREPTLSGIDRLELTLGRIRFIDLGDPGAILEKEFGIDEAVFSDVNNEEDLQAVLTVIALRSGISWLLEAFGKSDSPSSRSSGQ